MTYKELRHRLVALESDKREYQRILAKTFVVLDKVESELIILREWSEGNDDVPIRVALAVTEMSQIFEGSEH